MIDLLIGDTHAGYHHPDALDFLATLKRQYKPDRVWHLGDEVDNHRLSAHKQRPGLPSVSDELREARAFVTDLGKLFPDLKICLGNHITRVERKAEEAGLTSEFLVPWAELIKAPRKWQWSKRWDVPGLTLVHGDGYRGEKIFERLVDRYRTNVAFGHLHTLAGPRWFRRGDWLNFAIGSGCLINPASEAFSYAEHDHNLPMLGASLVTDGVPFFVPLSTWKG